MKKINAKKLLNNIEAKEADLQKSLEDLKPNDLSESGRTELIERVESMIDKMESWKARLKEEMPRKKAS